MARKSSLARFGKDYLRPSDSGEGGTGNGKPPEEPAEKQPSRSGGFSRFFAVVLLLVSIGLAVGLVLSLQTTGEANKRLEAGNEIGSLYLEGMDRFRKEDFAGARESFDKALARAREFQLENPDSYIESLTQEIRSVLNEPAMTRGKSGAMAQKCTELRKLVKELEPTDIYLQLGEKADPVLGEHVRRMKAEEISSLIPDHVDGLVDRKLSELDEKSLAERLGGRLDAVLVERLSKMTISSLRLWLRDRLSELVRSEIERRRYDTGAMNELLGDRRVDIVRSFLEGAEGKELADLLESRFDELERIMAKKMVARQARVTLDDGTVWEGQILHEGPLDMRFLKSDGGIYSIPKSRIRKTEPLLRPDDSEKEPVPKEEPEKPEPEKEPEPADPVPPGD